MGIGIKMSIILHLGVFNEPYTEQGITTGEVATILEKKYRIMEGFYELNSQDIADELTKSLNDALFSVQNGADPLELKPFDGAINKIQTKFKQFIEAEDLVKLGRKGVPTMAALKGYSSRLKNKKGGRRPSFRDTGLLESSFTCWIETK